VSDQSFGTTQKAPQLVGNKHKGVLPHTGGSGIVAFIIIGAVLIGAGGFYFYKRQQTI
jgi:LPXTG-motif cell wall-anchored protein